MKRTILLIMVTLMLPCTLSAGDDTPAPDLTEVLKRIKSVYSKHCCFKADFDQVAVNVAMDLRDRFKGEIFVKRPKMIALEVAFPERQKVVVRGNTYTIYFPDEGNTVKGDIPPNVNLESFFGFFVDIASIERDFSVSFATEPPIGKGEELIRLQLEGRKKKHARYRIMLGIDPEHYTIRRAIIYDALGNYNRFDLSNVVFTDSLDDSHFRIGPAKQDSGLSLFLKKQ